MPQSNIEILAQRGMLCLRRSEWLSHPGTIVTEITLNHEFLMSSYRTSIGANFLANASRRTERRADRLNEIESGRDLPLQWGNCFACLSYTD